MPSRIDPSLKMAKAAEFLEVADVALAGDCYDSAVSLSASAAINAADALCLHSFGRYSTSQGHDDAVVFVGRAGVIGRSVATQLSRILAVKNKAQYANARCSPREAADAVKRATRIVDLVQRTIVAT
jgi:hypothetical protein